MESKFVIFLVLACLAQSSYGSLLKVDYGLPDAGVVVLEQIMVNLVESKIISSKGVEILFDQIRDSDTEADDLCSEVTEAFDLVKNSIDLILDAIELVGGDCENIEHVRIETSAYIDNVASQIYSALELARCGNYFENQAAIEDYRLAVQEELACLTKNIYDLISSGFNTTDAEVEVVIERAKNTSLDSLDHAINAIFNAIKLATVAVDAEPKLRETVKTYIEKLRVKTIFASGIDVDTISETLQALYISSQLKITGITSSVAAILRAQIVSQARYTEGMYVIFETLTRYLTKISYGLSDDGRVAVPQDFLDLETVIKLIDAAQQALLASDLRLHPDAAAKINTTREELRTINVNTNIAIYGAVAWAVAEGADCSETPKKIEELKLAIDNPVPEHIDVFINPIRDDMTFEPAIETQLVYLQNLTTSGGHVATVRVIDGVMILANAYTCKGKVTDETFSAINILLAEAIDGFQYFTQGLAAAALLVLQVINAS